MRLGAATLGAAVVAALGALEPNPNGFFNDWNPRVAC